MQNNPFGIINTNQLPKNFDLDDDVRSISDSANTNSNFQVEQNQIDISSSIKEEGTRRRKGGKRKRPDEFKPDKELDKDAEKENYNIKQNLRATEDILKKHNRDPANDISHSSYNNFVNSQAKPS